MHSPVMAIGQIAHQHCDEKPVTAAGVVAGISPSKSFNHMIYHMVLGRGKIAAP